jgi:hypothetical protein
MLMREGEGSRGDAERGRGEGVGSCKPVHWQTLREVGKR